MNISGVAYQKGHYLKEVALEDSSEILELPDTFIWLELYEPNEAILLILKEEFHLHELAVEDAHHAHQRPKIEEYGDSLFIVLKTAQLYKEEIHYGETHLFVGSRFLIVIRHQNALHFEKVRERCEHTPDKFNKGIGFALYVLLDFIVDHYLPILTQLEITFESLETDIFTNKSDRLVIERLYALRRELLTLRNAVLPISDICHELLRLHEHLIPKELRHYFRDIHDHITRLTSTMDNMREMLNTAMQVNLALVGFGQNEIVKRLAGWGAILAIPTVTFSMYGMNFQNMPELQWKYGYPCIVIGTIISCIFLYRKLRNEEWI